MATGEQRGDSQLPVIDLSPLSGRGSREAREEVGRQVREACLTYGIFYVTGHGMGDTGRVFDASRAFFSLTQQEKDAIPVSSGKAGFTRGYIEMGGESGSERLEVRTQGGMTGKFWTPNMTESCGMLIAWNAPFLSLHIP